MNPTVALHGFTQTPRMFAEVAAPLGGVAGVALPGHAGGAAPVSLGAAVSAAAGALAGAAPRPLLGYSMGGRVALHVALARPELVSRLVLVSASPGIADPEARARRRDADEELASSVERDGVEAFVDAWLGRPMFAGLAGRGPEWRAADRRSRLAHSAEGLAAALRALGQGALPYVGDRVGELAMPVLVVAGQEDERYVAIGERMAGAARAGELVVVRRAGHAVIGETPDGFVAAVESFLT